MKVRTVQRNYDWLCLHELITSKHSVSSLQRFDSHDVAKRKRKRKRGAVAAHRRRNPLDSAAHWRESRSSNEPRRTLRQAARYSNALFCLRGSPRPLLHHRSNQRESALSRQRGCESRRDVSLSPPRRLRTAGARAKASQSARCASAATNVNAVAEEPLDLFPRRNPQPWRPSRCI